MAPAVGTGAANVPFETQFLLAELVGQEAPIYAVLLPLTDRSARATLFGGRRELRLLIETGDAQQPVPTNTRALFVAAGPDPFELVRRSVDEVSARLQTFRPLSRKTLPGTVDSFGWCTWDAFYSSVSPSGVCDGIRSLQEAGVPPRFVILDDGWQSVSPTKQPSEAGASAAGEPIFRTASSVTEGATGLETTANAGSLTSSERLTPSLLTSASSRLLSALCRWLGTVMGAVVASFTDGIQAFYDRFVAHAPHGSPPNALWALLTRTVLKRALHSYFEEQTDFARQLSSFEPNSKFGGSSESLAVLVRTIKEELGVSHVYAWHALHGYWRGLAPSLGASEQLSVEQTFAQPSPNLLRLEPRLRWDPTILWGAGLLRDSEQLRRMYDKLHGPLAEAGVDGVKVDVQAGLAALGGGVGGGVQLSSSYVRALEASVASRFGSNLIHCMCHTTENLYQYEVGAVIRASDDFYPERPDSHTTHIISVAYNSLFLGEIALPDWDMFTSRCEAASLHAAARAVGGCPVYVSDAPGQHDAELLRRLVLPDGSILRARLPGRPTRDSLFVDVARDGLSALKVWNANTADGAVVAAFNVQGVGWDFNNRRPDSLEPAPVVANVRPMDAETLNGFSGGFVAWRHRGGSLEQLSSAASAVDVTLRPREWEIVTFSPIRAAEEVQWAPIGLVDMLNSGGGVLSTSLEQSKGATNSKSARVRCRCPGCFVAFCQPAPTAVYLNGVPTPLSFHHMSSTGQLTIMLPAPEADAQGQAELSVFWSAVDDNSNGGDVAKVNASE